ncbi:MAG: hypothetical protein KGI08_04960 [Thaumarchaeota archaeon]|nr:hypothetical protein [Nitrososphaerota archaeon]
MATIKLENLTSKFGGMLGSPEVIAVAAAAFLTPLVSPYVTKFAAKIPFLGQHYTMSLIIIAFLVFILASKTSHVAIRAALIGLAGAFMILAISPFVGNYIQSDLK